MKLVYLTPNTYPAKTADDFYTREMAGGFDAVLRDDFLHAVASSAAGELRGIRHESLAIPFRKYAHEFRFYLRYFFWSIGYILRKGGAADTVFFTGDPNIALILILIKKLFFFRYGVATDWHMYFKTKKYRFIIRQSDVLISTSERLKKNLVKDFGVDPAKIRVAYGAVDLAPFEALPPKKALREKLGLPQDKKLVGYIGFFKTMGMEKGVGTMIRSLALLPDPNICMALVGGRKEQIEEYAKLADKEGVRDRVIFVEVVPSEKIPEYEAAMDALAIPYPDEPHFREYGFPMKVYEYMAAGVPIIYSNLDIISEMLSDAGTVFIPENPKDFARAVSETLSSSPEIVAKKARGLEKVQDYSWEKKAAAIVDTLR